MGNIIKNKRWPRSKNKKQQVYSSNIYCYTTNSSNSSNNRIVVITEQKGVMGQTIFPFISLVGVSHLLILLTFYTCIVSKTLSGLVSFKKISWIGVGLGKLKTLLISEKE